MNDLPPASALVLVSILPSTKDFDIARMLGWYRIPLRKAPKVVDVDYLAFYQPGAFGPEHRWQVEYFSEVKGNELALRRELFRDDPNHPRANEEYYKLALGPLQRLPRPIMAGSWRRLSFLYTNGERLITAETIKDLVVHTEERGILWNALRERALHSGGYQVGELPEFPLDVDILKFFGISEIK